jgi:hypothetical protein
VHHACTTGSSVQDEQGEGDPFDGLGIATCRRDLTTMDVAATDEAPYFGCRLIGSPARGADRPYETPTPET